MESKIEGLACIKVNLYLRHLSSEHEMRHRRLKAAISVTFFETVSIHLQTFSLDIRDNEELIANGSCGSQA